MCIYFLFNKQDFCSQLFVFCGGMVYTDEEICFQVSNTDSIEKEN